MSCLRPLPFVFFIALLNLTACTNLRELETGSADELASEAWREAEFSHLLAFDDLGLAAPAMSLLREAMQNNVQLRGQAERLLARYHHARGVAGDRLPSLDLELNRQRTGTDAGKSDTASGRFVVAWEVDIWGRVASQADNAVLQWQQQAALYRSARYSFAAQFLQQWLDCIETRQQLLLAERRQQSLKASLEIIRDGFERGIRDALDVYSAQAELANNDTDVARLNQTFAEQRRQLSYLLGRFPSVDIDIPGQSPVLRSPVPEALAADLIQRRPDVEAAESAVRAQFAAVNTAFSNRLPRLVLTGRYGAASDSLNDVVRGDDMLWNAIGGLTAPLFRGRSLAAESERQQALLRAAQADYRDTLLNAFREVEQSLDNETWLRQRHAAAENTVAISRQSEAIALEQYIAGISNLNTWLQAQRSSYNRESQMLQIRTLLLKNRIGLYLALGGDFGDTETGLAGNAEI